MSKYRKSDAVVVIDGAPRVLRLTLGALAELEETLGDGDFSRIGARLAQPRIVDILLILKALLAGGGYETTLESLKAADLDLARAAQAIAQAFRSLTTGDGDPSEPGEDPFSPACGGDVREADRGGARREPPPSPSATPPPQAGEEGTRGDGAEGVRS